MKSLTRNLKNGNVEIIEIPSPLLNKGNILVQNYYSAVSVGTESKSLIEDRSNIVDRLKSKKNEIRKVIDKVKTDGISEAYRVVTEKLNKPAAMGYSCVGKIISVANDIRNFKIGDIVACGGLSANHSEVVSVPANLCVKVPDTIDVKLAAYTTIASIAIQGIRQAEISFGCNTVVIGLGILGQLTMLILEAAGINGIGIDIDDSQVNFTKSLGFSNVFNRNLDNIEEVISNLTSGFGTDSVIITAATASHDPVNFAGKIARKKANIVIVGDVPTGFDRQNYFSKELNLKMSSSYGPGRYDSNYETKGLDYPIGYVRWTENRNMESFVDLLIRKKIDVDKLTTHIYDFDDAPKAYDMILNKKEHFSGVLIKYVAREIRKEIIIKKRKIQSGLPSLGFIGAGSFAQNVLMPKLKKNNFVGIVNAGGHSSKFLSENYGFEYCTDDVDKLINDKNINTIFITSRHNLHCEYVIKAINAGKNVFVEKPLVITEPELEEVKKLYMSLNDPPLLMVGFNRRFSPLVQKIKKYINNNAIPVSINININAGMIAADNWVNDPEIGGGRIIGEVCHFIDLASFLTNSNVEKLSAFSMENKSSKDTVIINLFYNNGSVVNISYFTNGNKNFPKERIEIFSEGLIFQINDFKILNIIGKTKKSFSYKKSEKGHTEELNKFLEAIKLGNDCPISPISIFETTLISFKILESISTGEIIKL
jgi:polar amino acid transport system substrate-binding protein